MHTLRVNNKNLTTLIFFILGVVWLNFVLLPCVHAVTFDQQTNHKCPHCPAPEKDFFHNKNDCDDCNHGLNTLKSQNNKLELDDNPKFTALPSLCDSENVNETKHSVVPLITTVVNYSFPPIYLQNSAFLN